MVRQIIAFLLLFSSAWAADTIEAFGIQWKVPIGADWKYDAAAGAPVLQLLVPRPSTQPRRPTQFALAELPDFLRVTVEAEVKQEPEAVRRRHNSLIIVYAYRDADHFNYAHLSVDAAGKVPVHNGIFHVYGGDRVRISSAEGPASLAGEEWHNVRLVYDGGVGRVDVWVNGQTSPSLRAVDLSLRAGKVGLGSFFDMGQFRNVKITGSR